jgi:RNA polymerase sigma factor (sigma-70 family)
MILSVCRGLLGNPHDAEDAFQATFLVLARKAGALRQPDLLGPWLYKVAHRAALQVRVDNARRKRREAEAAMSEARPAVDTGRHESGPAVHEEIEALHQEIDRLPEKYRTAIVLCDLQGLTHEEAARRLGRPVGTISARVSRARDRLRGRLSRRGLALPAGVMAAAMGTTNASAMPAALVDSTIQAAMAVSAGLTVGVPASIATLSQGVLRSMLLTKLRIVSAAMLMVGVAAAGVGVLAQSGAPRRVAPGVAGPALKTARASSAPAAENRSGEGLPRETERIVRSAVNLARITKGIHAYFDANQYSFPPQAIVGADGKPLLSWRVAILPYLGEKALYEQFKRDEPWDGPHNKTLLAKMPKFYAPLDTKAGEKHATYYQVFVGGGALFEISRKVAVADVRDGTVNTLMVVEAELPVPWTKPEDLPYATGEPLPKLGGQFKDAFVAVTGDGAVRFIKNSLDPGTLHSLITRSGGEVIQVDEVGEAIDVPQAAP